MVQTASGSRKAKAVPLIMGDTVEKADIEICKHPSGKGDWLLGTGASGKVHNAVLLNPCCSSPFVFEKSLGLFMPSRIHRPRESVQLWGLAVVTSNVLTCLTLLRALLSSSYPIIYTIKGLLLLAAVVMSQQCCLVHIANFFRKNARTAGVQRNQKWRPRCGSQGSHQY